MTQPETGTAAEHAARRKPRSRLPLVVLGVGAVLTLWFLLGFQPAPRVPADEAHRTSSPPAGCLSCHARGARHPQPPDHTNREACFSCHRAN